MQADLKLTSSEYSLILSIFFVVSPIPNRLVGDRLTVAGIPSQRSTMQYDPFPHQAQSFPPGYHGRMGTSPHPELS